METREVRAFTMDSLELRAEDDAKDGDLPTIRGHAAVFDKWSEDLGGFKEIIRSGAFDSALDRPDDVRALVDHDPSKILGRTTAGTLSLKVDSKGLKVAIKPADTGSGRDIVESIRRKDVDSMSFSFRTISDRWGHEDDVQVRELLDLELFDVSPVSYPAYRDTDVAVRSMKAWQEKEAAKPPKADNPNQETRVRIAEYENMQARYGIT